MKRLFLPVFLLLSALCLKVEAQIIQQYNFAGATGNEATFSPDGQPVNGALSDIKRGSGITPNAGGGVFNSKGFTQDAALDTADYVAFAIKANDGFQLNLDSLVFGQKRSNSGVRTFAVRSSRDGFAQNLLSDSGTVAFSWNNKVVAGSAFQGIPSSETLEFRIYGYNCPSPSGTWRLDSVRIYGNIGQGGVVVSKPKLSFSPSSLSFTESAGPQQATLQFSAQPSVEVSGVLYVKSGTAAAGTDYEGFDSIPFTFTPGGSLSFSKPVNFLDDAATEANETLTLVLRKTGLVSDTAYDLGPDSLFTFTITDNDAPVVVSGPPTRSIAEIIGAGTGNQADSVGKSFRVFGTVYGLNQRLSTPAGGYQMFIRDATGGIGIFKNAPVSGITTLNEGDSLRVMGKIECFRGLSQINIDSMVVLASGLSLKNPDLVSVLTESDESNLVKVENLTINPVTWTTGAGAGGFTAKAFNGTDSLAIRIDNDCPLYSQPAPSGTFSIIGMVGQFVPGSPAPVAPFPTSGYQLIPRRISDVVSTTALNPLCNCRSISVSPNPGSGLIRVSGSLSDGEKLIVSDVFGRSIGEYRLSAGVDSLDLASLSSGIYLFRFERSGEILRWVKN